MLRQLFAALPLLTLAACSGLPRNSNPDPPGANYGGAPVALATLRDHANAEVARILPQTPSDRKVFDVYTAMGTAKWAKGSWTGKVDLSGVAWDSTRTCTLISPIHVLFSDHYERNIGARILFHDHRGKVVERMLVRRAGPPQRNRPDLAVGLLDEPVPIRPYRVLPPRDDWDLHLAGANAVVTKFRDGRQLLVHEIAQAGNGYVRFKQSASVDPFYHAPLVGGDSSNPGFLLLRGEPVLIETHSGGGSGTGPLVSDPGNFAAINQMMAELGGGYQLSVFPISG